MSERGWDPPPEPGAPEPGSREEPAQHHAGDEPAPPDWRDERDWKEPEAETEPLWTRLREAPGRLPAEQRLAGAAAIGIVLSMFLPWWRDPVFGLSYMAFNRFGWIEFALLLICGAVLFTLFRRAEGRVFHLPLSDGTLAAAAGLWCCALLFARVLGEPTRTVNGTTYGYDTRWGVVMCLLCSVVLAGAGCSAASATIGASRRRWPRTKMPTRRSDTEIRLTLQVPPAHTHAQSARRRTTRRARGRAAHAEPPLRARGLELGASSPARRSQSRITTKTL